MINVAVYSRHALVTAILRHIFAATDVSVVAEPNDLQGLVDVCADRRPAVAVAAVDGDDIAPVASRLIALGTRLLMLGDDMPAEHVHAALLAGASGYLVLRDTVPSEVVRSVRMTASGQAALHPVTAAAILEQWRAMRTGGHHTPQARLTAREVEVVAAAAEGLTTSAIATRLRLATKTVETHKTRIFAKLGVRTQAQAVAVAISRGLLETPAPVHVPAATADGARP